MISGKKVDFTVILCTRICYWTEVFIHVGKMINQNVIQKHLLGGQTNFKNYKLIVPQNPQNFLEIEFLKIIGQHNNWN